MNRTDGACIPPNAIDSGPIFFGAARAPEMWGPMELCARIIS